MRRGYEVDEIIDQKYVLENNEDYKNGKQRAADQALGFAAKAAVVMGKYAGLFAKDGIELAQEYMDNPEETAQTLRTHADGLTWVYTGDLGTMDEEGFVYFKGRAKRMIDFWIPHPRIRTHGSVLHAVAADKRDVLAFGPCDGNRRRRHVGER